MEKFRKLGLTKETLDILEKLKFSIPTQIQEETIPLILEGKDIIGNAATGSGKTLAFASGIIENTIKGKGIQALILAPTRELALQIAKSISIFSKNKNLKVVEIYGGVDINRQISEIKRADIIVGTPGRILDHLQRETLNLSRINTLVLDEADRMGDMGFLPDVEKIISQCPKKRQTLLFSATNSSAIKIISERHMKNPLRILVEKYVDSSKLYQCYYDSPSHLKFSLLVDLIKKEKTGIVMIFCNTRRNVDLVEKNLSKYRINACAIHGGKDQKRRNRIIEELHKNKLKILVCTDVAARGLDIKGVTHVYNYDLPDSTDKYIHRIGRTARAEKNGMAISLVSSRDYNSFGNIMQNHSLKIERKELPKIEILKPDFKSNPKRRKSFGRKNNFRKGLNNSSDKRGRYHRTKKRLNHSKRNSRRKSGKY